MSPVFHLQGLETFIPCVIILPLPPLREHLWPPEVLGLSPEITLQLVQLEIGLWTEQPWGLSWAPSPWKVPGQWPRADCLLTLL